MRIYDDKGSVMKPEYTKDRVRLFRCDCMDFMREVPDKYYELGIIDPPYGIGESGGELHSNRSLNGAGKLKSRILNTGNTKWDNAPNDQYFNELFRVSQNQIIWGGNYFPLPPARGMICWDKKQPWENFSQFELAWTSFRRPARMFRFDNRYSGKIHPTQKPIALYRWLLTNYAKPGDKIFDSHGGSFSSACACIDMKFEFDGCELDPDYFKAAVNRLENHNQLYLDI
jgi:site-specific DNA-methyltransferase (adenine-specific)